MLGGVSGSFKRGMDSIRYKMKGSTSLHGDRCARVVRKHEDGSMVRRVFAPPPLPVFVGPRTSDRSKHISTKDPGTDVVKAARREFIVNAGCSSFLAEHLSKGTRSDGPFVQRDAANAKWSGEVLVGASTVAIDGNREAVDAKLGLAASFLCSLSQRLTATH